MKFNNTYTYVMTFAVAVTIGWSLATGDKPVTSSPAGGRGPASVSNEESDATSEPSGTTANSESVSAGDASSSETQAPRRKGNSESHVVIHKIEDGKISGRARCNYAGEYEGLPGSIELVIENNRVTYLDARADSGRCRISLDTFKQEQRDNSNSIILKNPQGCTVVIGAVTKTVRNDGVEVRRNATTAENALLSFGVVQDASNACSSICYSLAGSTGFWQIEMDPATDTCR